MTFEELRLVVRNNTQKDGPRIYRDLYSVPQDVPFLELDSWEAWHALPLLTKSVLELVPVRERIFKPLGLLDSIRSSSGTSGRPPLFSVRMHEDRPVIDAYNVGHHLFTRPVLCVGLLNRFAQNCHMADTPYRMIALDPLHLRASVRIAKAAGIDAIIAGPTLLSTLIPLLEEAGIAKNIRYVETSGDAMYRSLFSLVRERLPNAVIMSTYGISEAGGTLGSMCHPMDESEPLEVFHPADAVFLELINPETGLPVEKKLGAVGELVATNVHGSTRAFPCIRYATNDRIRIVGESCEIHGSWSFEVLGRITMDAVKIPGGILQMTEIKRVIKKMQLFVGDQFEAHYRATSIPFQLTLHVQANPGVDLDAIARTIADSLRIAPQQTYADVVAMGTCAPLICVPLVFASERKLRRLVEER